MNTSPRHTFSKKQRLSGKKAIEGLFDKGKSFSISPFRVVWLPENKSAVLQAGVGVSSRYFKKAVDRNRIKRLMKEAWRLQKSRLEETLGNSGKRMSVFILFTGNEIPTHDMVFEKTEKLINKLLVLTDG